MLSRHRIIPLVVAAPMFLQNLDTSVMATALPSTARALDVQALQPNLAITSYLLGLAVFLPMSGWLADRFGAKRIFCVAVAAFSLGSALCGLAQSLPQLVVFRVLQGLGGAMMLPVGRLVGGIIVTLTSWRWIFLINILFGLLAIAGAMYFHR